MLTDKEYINSLEYMIKFHKNNFDSLFSALIQVCEIEKVREVIEQQKRVHRKIESLEK